MSVLYFWFVVVPCFIFFAPIVVYILYIYYNRLFCVNVKILLKCILLYCYSNVWLYLCTQQNEIIIFKYFML